MAERTHTPEQIEQALALYVEHGAAEAARRLFAEGGVKVDPSTIRKWASRAHVTQARETRVREAVAATRLNAEARRATLSDDLLMDVIRLEQQLFAPAVVHHWGTESERDRNVVTSRTVFMEHQIDEPTFSDKRQLAIAIGTLIDKVELLSGRATGRVEQTIRTPEQAVGRILHLTEAVRRRAEQAS